MLLEETPEMILITDLQTVQFINNNLASSFNSRAKNILSVVVVCRMPKEGHNDKEERFEN